MPHHILNRPDDLAAFTWFLANLELPVTEEWVQGRARTQVQNALQWRLVHGVPILRESSPEFRDLYDRCIKPLPFELKKVALPRLGIKVTSAMKVRQMVRYMDAVQRECLEYGFHITDPELAKYQDRYRQKDAP